MASPRRLFNARGPRCSLALLFLLAGVPARGQDFQVTELSALGCRVVEHDAVTGDDRGGIAVSTTHVFYTGDWATGRFDLEDLFGGTSVGRQYDALMSDLATGVVYSLGDGETPIAAPGGTVTNLLEIDGRTGALTGTAIELSMAIPASEPTGIFAGYGRVVLHTGGVVYDVALPSGEVTDLGVMPAPPFYACESWAFWGVAEHFGGSIHLVYRQDSEPKVVRTRVPDGETTTAATFSDLADMCSLTVSPLLGRWYFHHEFISQFGGSQETVGFCHATWAISGSADLSVIQTDSADPVAAGTSILYTLEVRNDGPDDATGVRVTDRLPQAADLVSAMPSQGSCSLLCDMVVCELGDLLAGAGAIVTLEVVPWVPGSRTNDATTAGDQIDPDPSNNQVLENTEVEPARPGRVLLSIDRGSSLLRVIDPSSGAALAYRIITLAGETVGGGNGLATHPLTGELWALLRLEGQDGRELVTLHPASGIASRVGNTGDRFAGLAFDAGGTLYGITGRGAQTPEALFVLSQTDAASSFVLSLADDVGGEAIAFAPDGLLYHASGADRFESVDLDGPTVTDVGTCGAQATAAAALTHLGGDTLLLANRFSPELLAITKTGRRSVLGRMDYLSKGLAFAEVPFADLALDVDDAPDPATAGETLTYTLTLTNDGPDDVPETTVTNDLPGIFSLVSAMPSQGACEVQACGGLVCSLGDLAAGAGATVALEVTPLAAGDFTHAATVPALNDPDPSNNQASEATAVLPAASSPSLLSIDAFSNLLRVLDPGSGTSLAASPITLAGETVLGGNGLATHPQTGELWALLRLVGQQGRELVTLNPANGVATRVGDTGDRFAGLAFDAGGTLYGITGNGAQVPEALFILSQTDAASSFVLSLDDGGGGEAIAFNPVDGLLYHASDQLEIEAIDLAGPTVTTIATCTGDRSLRAGAMTHLGAEVLLLTDRNFTGLYAVTTAGGLAHVGFMDHSSKGLALTDLPIADLSVVAADAPDPVTAGDDLTYTLTVTNDGPDDVSDVTLLESLPGTVSLVSAVPSQGACHPQACAGLACSLGGLSAGASAMVTVDVVPLAAGSVTNTVSVPALGDPDPGNNQAAEVTTVLPGAPAPSLVSIDAFQNRLRVVDPSSGSTLALRIIALAGEHVIGGNGLATHPLTGELWALLQLFSQTGRELVTLDLVTGVATRVGDTGDRFAGLAFDAGGTLYGITGRGAQAPESLFALSQVDATPSFVISLADDVGGEAIAFNPEDGLLYHASGDLRLEAIDLAGPTATPIATCTDSVYTAALTHLDRDVLLLADRNSTGLYGLTTAGGLARIGSMDHTSKGLAWIDLPLADLALIQSDAPDPVMVGELLTYTLTVTNDGPEGHSDVKVRDDLPGTASLVSAVPSQGACEVQACGGLGCSLGHLDAGAGAEVTFGVVPLAAGSVTSAARVSALNDPDPADNQVDEVTTVLAAAPGPTLVSISAFSNLLRVVDPSSGATLASTPITLDGPFISGGNGLATHPLTGELWALVRLAGQDGRELVTVDLAAGAATRIGNTGDRFAGLAFDAGGTLYGITGQGAATPESLFVLSQTGAAPSFVVSLADGAGGETIAFNPEDGLLYHATGGLAFRSVDLAGPVVTPVVGCDIPSFHAGAMTHLGRDVLLLSERNGSFWGLSTAGRMARIGSLDHNSKGLAFIPACVPGDTTLCLPAGSGRFEARVSYQTVQGGGLMGEGRAVPLSPLGVDKGGVFYFRDPDNPKFLVKILDGCGVNGHHWLFYAATTNIGFELTVTDTLTGAIRIYNNPDLNPAAPVLDTQAFAACALPFRDDAAEVDLELLMGESGLTPGAATELGSSAPETALESSIAWPSNLVEGCIPGETTLCLPESDRFAVALDYQTVQGGGRMGEARAISLEPLGIRKGGIFYFFDAENPEMLVKVLDGCGINGYYWVFYAATTNVGFELTVMDTVAGVGKIYTNPDLNPAAPVLETRAFATCDF